MLAAKIAGHTGGSASLFLPQGSITFGDLWAEVTGLGLAADALQCAAH